jgi:hypothetical protein
MELIFIILTIALTILWILSGVLAVISKRATLFIVMSALTIAFWGNIQTGVQIVIIVLTIVMLIILAFLKEGVNEYPDNVE